MKKQYNIMTVCNEGYWKFLQVFVSSAIRHLPPSRVKSLIVYNTGLTTSNIQWLEERNIDVRSTNINNPEYRRVHDESWEKITYSKTSFLKDALLKDPTPTILIDADCIFINDMFYWIDLLSHKDFILCRTTYGKPKYIGSFFCVNNIEASLEFIEQWSMQIPRMTTTAKESPALSHIMERYGYMYNYGEIRDQAICAPAPGMISTHTSVIHYKSNGPKLVTVEQRLFQPAVMAYLKEYNL